MSVSKWHVQKKHCKKDSTITKIWLYCNFPITWNTPEHNLFVEWADWKAEASEATAFTSCFLILNLKILHISFPLLSSQIKKKPSRSKDVAANYKSKSKNIFRLYLKLSVWLPEVCAWFMSFNRISKSEPGNETLHFSSPQYDAVCFFPQLNWKRL